MNRMRHVACCLSLFLFSSEASALEFAVDEEARELVVTGLPQAPATLEPPRGEAGEAAEAAEVAPAPAPRELWRVLSYYHVQRPVPPSPVVVQSEGEELVVYCVDESLYEAHARTGVVRFRRMVPARCAALELVDGSKVEVTIDPTYRGIYTTSSDPALEMTALTYAPGEHVRGTEALPRVGAFAFNTQRQAIDHLTAAADEGAPEGLRERETWDNARTTYGVSVGAGSPFEDMKAASAWRAETPEGKAWSARALAQIEQGRALDPTNPWFALYLGMIHWELGARDDALAAWNTLPGVPHDLAHETVRMLPMLARVGAPAELRQRLRAHVAGALYRGGYEPELSTSMIWMAFHWRSDHVALDLTKPAHLEIADAYAEDWYALMPFSEGVDSANRRIAQAHREAGNTARAEELERRVAAHPGSFVTSKNANVSWSLYGLPFPPAFAFAVTLLLMVGVLRRFGARFVPEEGDGEAPWWLRLNPLATTNRWALAGMFALNVGGMYVFWRMALGVAFIGVTAASPISWTSNQLGNAEVGEYLEGMEQTPDVLFARGLHHQAGGELEFAKERYEEAGIAAASNNLGVILHAAGDAAGAEAAWEAAGDLEAARYNANREVTGDHSARLERYAPGHKMLALPTEDMLDRMYMGKARAQIEERGVIEVLTAQTGLAGDISGTDSSELSELVSSIYANLLFMALVLFGMLAPRRGYRIEPREIGQSPRGAVAGLGLVGWLVGLLTPGGAQGFGPLRPWLTAATFSSIMINLITLNTGGKTTSILLMISTPSYSRMLGVNVDASHVATPIDATLLAFGQAWWMIALGCLVLGFVAEFVRPDPVGQLARARAKRDDASE